jgi:hypothetical protein
MLAICLFDSNLKIRWIPKQSIQTRQRILARFGFGSKRIFRTKLQPHPDRLSVLRIRRTAKKRDRKHETQVLLPEMDGGKHVDFPWASGGVKETERNGR